MKIADIQQEIAQQKDHLFSQSEQTQQVWNDSVQRRYYTEFIEPYKDILPKFMEEMENVDKCIQKAKQKLM